MKQWRRRGGFEDFIVFMKPWITKEPVYFYSLVSLPNKHYNTRNCSKIRQMFCRTEAFSHFYLPQGIREWNKLNNSICQAPSYSVIRKALLDFTWQTANSTFKTVDVCGLKVLTRLSIGFSNLKEHKFKHIFQKTHWTHYAIFSLK